jgi:hypothetical protein
MAKEMTDRLRELLSQMASSSTIGEMDEVRAELDSMATQAATDGQPKLCAKLEDYANEIRGLIYAEIGKAKGLDEAQIKEMQQNHQAAIHADNMMHATVTYLKSADNSEVELFNDRMKRVLFGSEDACDLWDALEMGQTRHGTQSTADAQNATISNGAQGDDIQVTTEVGARYCDSARAPGPRKQKLGVFQAIARAIFRRT